MAHEYTTLYTGISNINNYICQYVILQILNISTSIQILNMLMFLTTPGEKLIIQSQS